MNPAPNSFDKLRINSTDIYKRPVVLRHHLAMGLALSGSAFTKLFAFVNKRTQFFHKIKEDFRGYKMGIKNTHPKKGEF